MANIVLRGLVLAGIYLVLVGQLSADEIGLAFGCGAIALGWSLALRGAAQLRFSFSPGLLTIAVGALAGVPRAIVEVGPALLWRRRGSIRREAATRGGTSSTDAARRAVTLLAISLAPDRYALRWAKHGSGMEIHRLSIGVPRSKAS